MDFLRKTSDYENRVYENCNDFQKITNIITEVMKEV